MGSRADPTAPPPGYAAVIGDVVRSREAGSEALDRVRDALGRANERLEALQPLQLTIGDEFQGVYASLGGALNATLLVRLLLHDVVAARFGVGWGGFTRWNPERVPYDQDGPAWWAAREALEAVRHQERGTRAPAGWLTAVRVHSRPSASGEAPSREHAPIAGEGRLPEPRPLDVPVAAAVEGLVMLRDHVLSRMDDRDVGLVLAVLGDVTATEAAERVGISQQAASRRLRNNGGYALLQSWRLLEGEG